MASDLPLSDNDPMAARLRGFGLLGLLAIVLILSGNFLFSPLSAILALIWVQLSRTPWREIGYVRPKSWVGSLAIAIAFGVAFKFLMKAVVMPLLGAPPINQAYHFLAGNTAAMPGMIFTLIVVAGIGEETLYRGWMFERLGKLLGTGVGARTFTVLFTSALFSLAHYSVQGMAGSEQAMITGLVFGTIFAATRSIFFVMVAHAAFDVAALAMIYWEFETKVAHFIFK